jgi:hypothetical protein
MVTDQQDNGGSRAPEAKNGATVTLLGEAIEGHLAGRKALNGRQVELFDAADPLPDDGEAGEGKRGRGRPPGAQNKATEAFRSFVRQRYGDPLLKIMERCFADPKSLAATLGAPSSWDVQKAQIEWLLRLMPYMHSAMPAELKVSAKGFFAVAVSSDPGQPAGDRMMELNPFQALLEYSQQNQGLSDPVAEQSHADQSHAEPVSLTATKG